jgi:hypothetical protein
VNLNVEQRIDRIRLKDGSAGTDNIEAAVEKRGAEKILPVGCAEVAGSPINPVWRSQRHRAVPGRQIIAVSKSDAFKGRQRAGILLGLGVTWIDGNQSAGCASLADGSVLTGYTLTNGYAWNGGGATCATSNTLIFNCLIVSNAAFAHYGGGVYGGTLSNCTLLDNNCGGQGESGGGAAFATLNNCTLDGNTGFSGGGAYVCTLNNCILYNNQALQGGAAANSTLINCLVSNNTASLVFVPVGNTEALGGGLFASPANNCNISYNHVVNPYGDTRIVEGGGAYASALTNCLLFMNTANQYFGGGGRAYGGTLNNCTIVANSTYATGGGVYDSTVNNSIIRLNGANYSGGTLSYCVTIPLAPGTGNFTNDPAFVNQSAYDFHLQSNSPCINSGNNAFVSSTNDLDGNPRIVGGTVDIGCYEYQTPSSIISYAWLQQYGLPTDGSVDFADLDGNGMNIYQDWIAGLNPTNATSVLALQPPATTNTTGITVTWQSVNTRTYYLQSSTNLPVFTSIQSNIVGLAGSTSYTDTTATNGGPYFYRVGVQ